MRPSGSRSSHRWRPRGRFSKDDFAIDAEAGTVTCPAGVTVPLRPVGHRARRATSASPAPPVPWPPAARARSGDAASRWDPTRRSSRAPGPHRRDPAWKADYRANRPKVERRIAHLMRRRHGGRRARVRGRPKVAADFSLLAAAVNLARLAVLGLFRHGTGWAVRPHEADRHRRGHPSGRWTVTHDHRPGSSARHHGQGMPGPTRHHDERAGPRIEHQRGTRSPQDPV